MTFTQQAIALLQNSCRNLPKKNFDLLVSAVANALEAAWAEGQRAGWQQALGEPQTPPEEPK